MHAAHERVQRCSQPRCPWVSAALGLNSRRRRRSLRLQAAGEHGEQWRASLAAPSLTLSLLYPEEGGGPSPHYAPRLVVEVLEVCAAAEVSLLVAVGGRQTWEWVDVWCWRRGWSTPLLALSS